MHAYMHRTLRRGALLLLCCLLALHCTAEQHGSSSSSSSNRRGSARRQLGIIGDDDLQFDNSTARAYCTKQYGQRRFARTNEVPPVLWTFPGSGNTWARLLIDFATGIYTGSVYDDRSLRVALPGESRCDKSVVMIKAHPHTHPFRVIDNGPFQTRCSTIPRFTKAVLLLRNPYDSIWSEFLRRMTGSHVGSVDAARFNTTKWQGQAVSLAMEYHNMWEQSYKPFMQKYPDGYLFVSYEALARRETRRATLRRWLTFMGHNVPDDRLRCAVLLSRHPRVQRVLRVNAKKKYDAYHENPSLVCKIWEIVRADAEPAGYQIWQNLDCSSVNTSTVVEPVPITKPIPLPKRREPAVKKQNEQSKSKAKSSRR